MILMRMFRCDDCVGGYRCLPRSFGRDGHIVSVVEITPRIHFVTHVIIVLFSSAPTVLFIVVVVVGVVSFFGAVGGAFLAPSVVSLVLPAEGGVPVVFDGVICSAR